MEANNTPHFIYRKDYTSPDWFITSTFLSVKIFDDHVVCQVRLELRAGQTLRPVILNGEGLELLSVSLNGEILAPHRYSVSQKTLSIDDVPDGAILEVTSKCDPFANTALEGLYASNGMLCTQCEPEGFRRICYYSDRPDVMSVFTTHIEAPNRYPNLLSNGNLVETGASGDGRHYALWHDPHPKPSYLFALVAGDLACVKDQFTTASGKSVDLHIYVEPGNEHLTAHAMDSLKTSMRWDEEVYGLEYDLELFQIVAVSHFNMGAMENKGLNIFNSKFVLADERTATDDDLARIEAIIAHEYFHNWTGNRVTCRDWFQLTLKEGLTVFRDQCFSADMHDAGVKRAEDVQTLRTIQFSEDASPTAHPIRPDKYAEINNFYTPTIYEKGAEVIRMMHTVLGPQNFRKGIDLYFDRHDGQAVTCDDFLAAMNDVTDDDLSGFSKWYEQAGTPVLSMSRPSAGMLSFQQHLAPTAAQTSGDPVPLPIRLGFVGRSGVPLRFAINGGEMADEHIFMFDSAQATIQISAERDEDLALAVPSVLRNFSAPVRLVDELSEEELAFLAQHDPDPMNRYETIQRLFHKVISARLSSDDAPELNRLLLQACQHLITDNHIRDDFKALALNVPGQTEVEQLNVPADPVLIYKTRFAVSAEVGHALGEHVLSGVSGTQLHDTPECRALLARLLYFGVTAQLPEAIKEAARLSDHENMTISSAALKALNTISSDDTKHAMGRFHDRWQNDSLVIEKWFMMSASSAHSGTVEAVEELMSHPAYDPKNPNKIRSVLGAFASANPTIFHAADGAGYEFVTRHLLKLDSQNPQIAARLGLVMSRFGHLTQDRQALMRGCLERLATHSLSPDLSEVVSKALNAD